MTAEIVLGLMLAFAVKHLIVDFFLQVPYHYMNKGTYGRMGGIEHASLHALSTLFVLAGFVDLNYLSMTADFMFFLAFFDFIIHYHVDWAKMRLNSKMGWKADTSEYFWWSLGVDQFLHQFTYIAIVWLILKGIG